MFGILSVAGLLGASLVQASILPKRQASDILKWQACPTADPPFECAAFQVPLDYANAAAGTTEIVVIRYPATQTPRKGSFFMNPGGPGVSGVDWLSTGGPSFQTTVGADWDVLSFDPRGVGISGPKLTQFQSDSEETAFWESIMLPGEYESHGNLTQADDVDFFKKQASAMDDRLKALDDLFVQRNGDNLKYLGSAAVIRDLAGLADAIEGPGSDINFYGYSYGTLLAMELTQMFPDRVGKVIIDGVVDPQDWSNDPPFLGWDLDIADAEAVYKGYTEACAMAGPRVCPLVTSASDTAADVDAVINKILDAVYKNWNNVNNYSHNEVLEVIFSRLYSPSNWDQLGSFLAQFLITGSNNARKGAGVRAPIKPLLRTGAIGRSLPLPLGKASGVAPLPNGTVVNPTYDNDPLDGGERGAYKMTDYAIVAIFCGDAVDNTLGATTNDVFNEIVRVSQTVSYKFGANFNSRFVCHRWSSRAVERYTGPWNKKPKNTVLVIGNEADPITPYRSAKRIASAEMLGSNARLVQQWDFGHTSGAETSDCTNNVIRNYIEGSLPQDAGNDDADTVCATNFSVLGNPTSTHFDPSTSENGDDKTSGANDPGLAALGKTDTGSKPNSGNALSAFASFSSSSMIAVVVISSVLGSLL